MNYTTGDWTITGRDANGAVNIFTDKENIATVRHEYDARLMAAAPMMYEALKGLLKPYAIPNDASKPDYPEYWVNAVKVLDKAEGK